MGWADARIRSHFCYVRTFVGSLHKQDLGMIAHQNTYVRTYVRAFMEYAIENQTFKAHDSCFLALALWRSPSPTDQPAHPHLYSLGAQPAKVVLL